MYITHIGKHQFSTGSEITNIIIYVFEKMAGSRQCSATHLKRVTEKEGLCFDRSSMWWQYWFSIPYNTNGIEGWRYSILDDFVSDTDNG